MASFFPPPPPPLPPPLPPPPPGDPVRLGPTSTGDKPPVLILGPEEQSGRRRRNMVGIAVAVLLAAVALVLACWWGYGTAKAMKYAKLADVKITRDWLDPESIGVSLLPISAGTVALRCTGRDGQAAELPVHIRPEDVGIERKVRWQIDGLRTGAVVEVVSREGWSLTTAEKAVPESRVPPDVAAAASDARNEGNGSFDGNGGGDDDMNGDASRDAARGSIRGGPRQAGRSGLASMAARPSARRRSRDGLDWLARHQAAGRIVVQSVPGARPRVAVREGLGLHGHGRDVRDGPHRTGGAGLPGRWILLLQRHPLFRRGPQGARLDRGASKGRRRAGGVVAGFRSRRIPPVLSCTSTAWPRSRWATLGGLPWHCTSRPLPATCESLPQGREVHRAEPAPRRRLALRRRALRSKLADTSDTSVTGWQVLALKSARRGRRGAERPLHWPACARSSARGRSRSKRRTGGPATSTTRPWRPRRPPGWACWPGNSFSTSPRPPWSEMPPATWPISPSSTGRRKARPRRPITTCGTTAPWPCSCAGGEAWEQMERLRPRYRHRLQERKGCQRGSWAPTDRWGDRGGRIYSTALAVLTLEVYYRYALEQPSRVATLDTCGTWAII